jgi:hypothetical protein
MGSRLAIVTALGFLSAGWLSAQVTVPAALAGIEGGGSTNIPFGSNQACRYQCIYDAEELPWSGPRVITGLLLRADNNTTGTAIPAKGFLDISVLVSTTEKNSATASTNFATNYGADATWVIQNQLIMLPYQAPLATSPRPASIPLVFNVPWAYGLTPAIVGQPAPKNLLVEIHIHSQPSGLYRLDNMGGCTAQQGPFGLAGPACAPAGGGNVLLTGDQSMLAGNTYNWIVDQAPPSMPFLLALNLDNTGGLFGNPAWPLPYPMFDPANPSQPSAALASLLWPAPDCYLNLTPAVSLGGVADALGDATVPSTLPKGRQFVGTTFHAQAIVLAPTANPLRLITSRGFSSTICGPLGVTRIYAFYNGATVPPPPQPTFGQLQYGVGLIFDVM